jgi:hypothetical protein
LPAIITMSLALIDIRNPVSVVRSVTDTTGTILQIEPTKLIKYSLPDLENREELLSLINYQLSKQEGVTLLATKEELNYLADKKQLKEASDG